MFYRSIRDGELLVESLGEHDWDRVADLVVRYDDIGLDAADASVVALAERHGQTTIATLDERDFRIVRSASGRAFDLLPGPG